MFYGKAMFPGTSTINQIEKVVAWTGPPTSAELKQISAHLNQAMQAITTRKKLNRVEFFGNKIHPSCLDLISRMLEFDPSKRITIEEVLRHEYLAEFYNEK
jgi:mitogen-activated protein kinase 15